MRAENGDDYHPKTIHQMFVSLQMLFNEELPTEKNVFPEYKKKLRSEKRRDPDLSTKKNKDRKKEETIERSAI